MIRPLGDRIIVQRFDTAVDKVGLIFIPDAAKERPNQGDVLAVGPGKLHKIGEGHGRHAPQVKVGDKILFGKYSGTEVKVDGRELLIVREDEIMGVIE
jgi:chaperonin GroES